MARSTENRAAKSPRATESEMVEVPSLAGKASALPTHLEPRAGQFADRDPAHSQPSDLTGPLGRLLHWLACLVTLALIAIALLRVTYHDGTHFLTQLNAFTRYVYLPAYPCLAWAIWKRRWILFAVNVALVCWHVALVAPDFVRDRRFDRATNSATADAVAGPTVRIFFANVHAENTKYQSLLDEIKDANPDVIMLVEFTSPWRTAFLRSPVLAAYTYGGGMDDQRSGTVNVFSRIALKSEKQNWFAGRGLETIEFPVGSETLHLIGLHAPRPMNRLSDNYEGYWSQTIPMVLNEKGPVVVIGDFNATQYSKVYEQLTADRLRSAHQDRGRGYATTWPNGQYWLPSLIRIDQALVSPEVECIGIKEGKGRGSDHKPLILDVRIQPTR